VHPAPPAGASLGLVYLPAVVTVGFWFERRRAIATGIGVCGSGVGTAAVALATDQLVDQLTWRGALMVLAGVLFNCVVAGSLLMPLDRYYDILAKRELRRLARGEPRVKGNIMRKLGSLNGWIITTANRVEPPPPDFDDRPMLSMEAIHRIAENVLRRKTPGYSAATAAAAASGAGSRRLTSRHSFLAEAAATAKGSLSQLAATVRGGGGGVSGVSGGISGGAGVGDFAQSQTSLAVGGVSSNDPAANQPHLVGAPLQPHTALNSEVPTPDQSNFASGTSLAGTATSAAGGPAAINGAAMALLSGSTEITEEVREAIGRSLRREVLRPLNRKDVFHSGSLRHVAEYCRATRAPALLAGAVAPVAEISIARPPRSALRKMLSPGMLRSPTFCLLMLGSVFTVLAWAGDRSWSDCLWVNNHPHWRSLAPAGHRCRAPVRQLHLAGCLRLLAMESSPTAAWTSLRTILVVDLMGLDRLTNAFGLLLLIQGAGLVVGPPLTAAFANGWAPAAALGPVGGPGLAASFYAAGALLALQWEAARAARAAAANNDETASYSGSHSYHGNNNNYSPNAASTFLVGGEIADYGQQQQPMHTPPPTIIVAPAADSAASTSAAPATGIEPLTYHDQFPAHEPPPLEEIESRI
uniref:MFS domain-containing protein n=1 Tax=Macrostomum lignano TaxID=282301 RepID=A0A1I8FRA9_9PLAT